MSTATSQRRIYGLSVSARFHCSDPVPIASPKTRRLLRTSRKKSQNNSKNWQRGTRTRYREHEPSPRREARLLDAQRCRSPRSDRLAQHLRRGDPWFHPHRGTSAEFARDILLTPLRAIGHLYSELSAASGPQARAVSGATVNRTKRERPWPRVSNNNSIWSGSRSRIISLAQAHTCLTLDLSEL